MFKIVAAVVALTVALQPVLVCARQVAGAPAAQPVPSVEALGVSFDRIKRELRITPASTNPAALKLDFYVEVEGVAPEIVLFTPEELRVGPVPGAPPTHWDMVRELWTRPEFRAPSVPISSLAIMGIMKLAQWQFEQAKRRKAEAERRLRQEELRRQYPDLVVK